MGCGRSRPKAELVRFVAGPGGVLERDPAGTRPGRGAYLCRADGAAGAPSPAPECARRALERRGFQRALRRPVRVDGHVIDLDSTGS
ncbi:MAG: YlxR family protein [Thermoleophilaceae bacterium]|nr:YlxR family protein [Thermoleophilaceae bacterium]